MLERSDYYINVPPQDVDITGGILPVSDIGGLWHPLRAEDAFYLYEFMFRCGICKNDTLPLTRPQSLISNVATRIIQLDQSIGQGALFENNGLLCFLDGALSGYADVSAYYFIVNLCSTKSNSYTSGIDSASLWYKATDANLLRRMYKFLNVKSKCWRVMGYNSYHAGKDGREFMTYVSGLNNLTYTEWHSSYGSTPYSEVVTGDASIGTGNWMTSTSAGGRGTSPLELYRVVDYTTSPNTYYIKGGGLLSDAYITVSFGRSDITELVGFVEYSIGTSAYRTAVVPFEKIGDTTWKAKIWDRAFALAFLASTGYDTSIIGGGAVSSDTKTAKVVSALYYYAYKVSDKADLPSEWNWSPS